uniref:Fatty-acid and retinol-binding protein 1 n=1 Tax=Haemonchus contortus TaxID=6289 RepID=A0A7I5E9L9_HAECO|nr:Protein C07G3.10 [Haemonchus contortus]
MKFYIILSICLVCFSAPLIDDVNEVMEKKEEKMLTMETFDGYLDMIKMFRGMLPQDLMKTIDNLNLTEKGELISFLSDWYNGRIKKPENKAEIVELLQEKLPTVYDKIHSLNTTFYTKFQALKPETQELLRSWRDKAVSLEGDTPAESAAKRLQFLRDVALSVQTMNNETKEDIRSQFPTAVNLTEGFGFTVLTTLAMIAQKIMESFSTIAAAVTGAPQDAPQECPIPAS